MPPASKTAEQPTADQLTLRLLSESRIQVTLFPTDIPGEGVHKESILAGIRDFQFHRDCTLAQKARFLAWGIEQQGIAKANGRSFLTNHGNWLDKQQAIKHGLIGDRTTGVSGEEHNPFA